MLQSSNLTKAGIILAKLIAAGMLLVAFGGASTEQAAHSAAHRRAAHAAGHGYDYYVLLRWVVCGVAAGAAFRAARAQRKGWPWVLGVVALFFNPIVPVHLTRETWGFIDVGVALLFLVSIPIVDLRSPSARPRDPEATEPRQGEADRIE